MKEFFNIKTSDDVFSSILKFPSVSEECIPLREGVGRVLAQPVLSPEDIPPFKRSTMDGFAVRARDTFGASESIPGLLTVAGKIVMGEPASKPLQSGECFEILTGGMLPPNADAVVMQEYTRIVDGSNIELTKSVAPGENVALKGEDFPAGTMVLPKGRRLRPQDLGLLSAIGRANIPVYRKPGVAIISTGDELVSVDETPGPGKIRDINAYALWGAVIESGAIPLYLGIVSDSKDDLYEKCADGLRHADIVLVSGGSSVGMRDFTASVFESLPGSEILIHGISVSPGKPTILARYGSRALWGLPGHPVSSLVVFWLFVRPLIQKMAGFEPVERFPQAVQAKLSRNVPSAQGREDYIRVKLQKAENGLTATPLFGKSGLISNLSRADGIIRIDLNTEGLNRDSIVDVYMI